MPWVILVGIILLIAGIADWIDKHPPLGPILKIGFFIAVAYAIWAWIKSTDWHRELLREAQKRRSESERIESENQEARLLATDWATSTYQIPTGEQFRDAIEQQYKRGRTRLIRPEFLRPILAQQQALYLGLCLANKKLTTSETKRMHDIVYQACVEGLYGFTTAAHPAFVLDLNTEHHDTPFVQRQTIGRFLDANPELSSYSLNKYYVPLILPFQNVQRRLSEQNQNPKIPIPSLTSYAESYLTRSDVIETPILIPKQTRFAGTWIVAPPGRGKTNLLHNMIAEDRKAGGTIILMDSKGDLINAYRGFSDVVVIDPKTVQINPLQLGTSIRSLDFLEYIFSSLLDTTMTPLQKTLFRTVLTLLLKIPNATILTFKEILTKGWAPYEKYVLQLHDIDRDFFVGKGAAFDSQRYSLTKGEVDWRLHLMLSNEYLRQIFTMPNTNIDFFQLLDSGKTIIIDNSTDTLAEEGAEFFGRFFVAMIWMAAVSRSKLRPEQKVPVYVYIDECQTVIKRDEKIAKILDECRSQKIALILAHQRLAQITNGNVLDALGNCAVRITNSDDDAAALAPRFRTEPEQLRLPVGYFALFVRDTTPAAITVSVPLFDMASFPAAPEDPPRQPTPLSVPQTNTAQSLTPQMADDTKGDGREEF